MSKYLLDCGHNIDGHNVIFISKEGFNAFNEWKKKYGKERIGLHNNIIKKGGGYKDEFILAFHSLQLKEYNICLDCVSKWKDYKEII